MSCQKSLDSLPPSVYILQRVTISIQFYRVKFIYAVS